MKNNIDDFIQAHRHEFDNRTPSERVWNKIQRTLSQNTRWVYALPFWRAAAIVFMVTSGWLLIQRFWENQNQYVVLREFQDVESFYVEQIADKIELIEAYNETENGLNGFTHDFRQLEAMYQVLKEEMRQRPSKQVKDALVLNLLVRIDLLNQQLHKLEKADWTENDKKPAAI